MQCSKFALFLGDLSMHCNEIDLEEAFSPYGTIIEIRVKRSKETAKTLSYGFLEFASASSAVNAMNDMDGYVLKGRPLRIRWAASKKNPVRKRDIREDLSDRISMHVKFMSYKIDKIISEELLRNLFSIFGEVCDTTIKQVSVDRKSHRLKGYGFVSFRNDEGGLHAAERALAELNEATIDEVTYKCEVSHILDTPPPPAPGYVGHPAAAVGMHHHHPGAGGELDYEFQLQQQNSYFDDYHNGFAGGMGEAGLYMGHSGANRPYESLYEQQQPLHSSGQASPAVLGGILPTSGKFSAYTSREVSPINSHGDICGLPSLLTDDIHNPFAFRGSGSGQPSPTNHHSMSGPGNSNAGPIGMGIGMGGGSKVISPTAAAFKSTPSSAAGGSSPAGTLYASQQSLAGKQHQMQALGMNNNNHGVPRPPYHHQSQQFHPSGPNHYPQQPVLHRDGSYGAGGYGLHHQHSAQDSMHAAHFEMTPPQPPAGMRRAYSTGSPHISSSSPPQQYWHQQSPLQSSSQQLHQQYPLHGTGEFGRNRYSPNSGYSSLQQPHISQKQQPYQQQRGSAGVYGSAGYNSGQVGAPQGLYGASRSVQQPVYARGALQQRQHSALPFAPQSYDLDIPGPSSAATSPSSALSRPSGPVSSASSRGGLYGDLSLNGLLGTSAQQQPVFNSCETTVSSSSDTLSLQCLGLGSASNEAFSILPGVSRSISSTNSGICAGSMFVHQSTIGKQTNPSLPLGVSSAPSMDLSLNNSDAVAAVTLDSNMPAGAEAISLTAQQQQQQDQSWLSVPYEIPQM